MRWTWDEVQSLPPNVYQVLVEELNREADELAERQKR
jgi:hypothetical protein